MSQKYNEIWSHICCSLFLSAFPEISLLIFLARIFSLFFRDFVQTVLIVFVLFYSRMYKGAFEPKKVWKWIASFIFMFVMSSKKIILVHHKRAYHLLFVTFFWCFERPPNPCDAKLVIYFFPSVWTEMLQGIAGSILGGWTKSLLVQALCYLITIPNDIIWWHFCFLPCSHLAKKSFKKFVDVLCLYLVQ